MRCLVLFTLVAFGMLQSSFALVDASKRTTVGVWANAWDERESGKGCYPDGCTADLTRDRSYKDRSRWSCSKDLKDKTCKIYYSFAEPQDIEKLCIALWKGDERKREIKVTFQDSDKKKTKETFKSSGKTEDLECIYVYTDETQKVTMEPVGLSDSEWLSILEVEFLVK